MSDFSIYLNSELSYSDVTFQSAAYVPSSEFGRDPDDIVQAVGKYNSNEREVGLLQFPTDRPKYYFMISFADYSRRNLMEVNADSNIESAIVLPLPTSLKDTMQVEYKDTELGTFFGGAINSTYNAVGGIAGARSWTDVGSSALGVVDDAINTAVNNPGSIAGAGGVLAGEALNARNNNSNARARLFGLNAQDLSNAASAVSGFSPNKFMTVLLKGPSYKSHTFSWQLAPKNARESEIVRQIIRKLNNSMSPGIAVGGMLFSFPKVIRCAIMPNFQYLFRFKPAVITKISIDYAPNGIAFYHSQTDEGVDNPPESVVISFEMQELEYWLKGDYLDGGDADDTNGGSLRNALSLDGNYGLRDFATTVRDSFGTVLNNANNVIQNFPPVGD